jgi:hypothetical protein
MYCHTSFHCTSYPKEMKLQSWHITVPTFIILYIKIPFHLHTQLFHKELSLHSTSWLTSCIRGNLVSKKIVKEVLCNVIWYLFPDDDHLWRLKRVGIRSIIT